MVFETILKERKQYEANRRRRSTTFQDLDYICCSTYGRPRSKNYHWQHYKKLLADNGLPSRKNQNSITVNVVKGAVTTKKLTLKNKATNKLIANKRVVFIKKGKSIQLKPVVSPITSASKLSFKSSKKSVAIVTSKGKVIGKKAGKATITVTSGKKKVTFIVKVK